ncbi:MAG: hypothetical protein LBV71_02855 [Prevotella sp.]|jgi:hypothetical protein|nr:hypothetical protein [Prevotella sp.]
MKKLFFFLTVATVLFASCSSSDESDPVDNGKTYKVKFNVSNFTSDISSLKAENTDYWPTSNYCQYAIYKASGELVKSKLMETGSFDPANVEIEGEVSAGNYWIAIVSASSFNNMPVVLADLSNINTDYCLGNTWISRGHDNVGIYYEKLAFTAGESATEVNDVVLNPMWSHLNIKVSDADVCYLPEGTTYVQCVVSPYYYGFRLKDGVSSQKYEASPGLGSDLPVPVAKFRSEGGMESIIVSYTKDATVKFVCMTNNGTVLSEKVIYTGDIEKGKYITFNGSLGSIESNASFNLSLADLTDGGVIPFN